MTHPLARVAALLPVFNDARYLPGWFEAVGQHVGACVVLDDGSTDGSVELLESNPLVTRLLRVDPATKTGWDEPANRERLVRAGQELDVDWFVAFDADERPAAELWRAWPELVAAADRAGAVGIDQPLREIWDSADTYRSDGVWGQKRKIAAFRNLGEEHTFDPAQWHGEWFPAQYIGSDAFLRTDIELYHLKMLRAEDRLARMRRYQEVDPGRAFQPIGYEYLTDERGLALTPVDPERGYTGVPVF